MFNKNQILAAMDGKKIAKIFVDTDGKVEATELTRENSYYQELDPVEAKRGISKANTVASSIPVDCALYLTADKASLFVLRDYIDGNFIKWLKENHISYSDEASYLCPSVEYPDKDMWLHDVMVTLDGVEVRYSYYSYEQDSGLLPIQAEG